MTWTSEVCDVNNIDIQKYEGFVYKITELQTGMMYYGIKKFKKRIRRKPLKGKKRVRIDYVESDWKTYSTSSPELSERLHGSPESYKKEILVLCTTVVEMKATEAYLQLKEYMDGNWHNLINQVINLRLRIR